MKGDVDIFLVGLAVGIILIVGAYLSLFVKRGDISISARPQIVDRIEEPEPSLLEFPSSGLVGESPDLAAITRDFGTFYSKNLDTRQYFGNVSGAVKNGLLYGRRSLEFAVQGDPSDFVDAWVVFGITKTNKYGRLLVRVNNCTVADRIFEKGRYEMSVPLSCLSNETLILFYPRSSGWRIWAPTYYEIENASLSVSRYFSSPALLRFSLDREQYDSFQKANLHLNFLYYDGELRVVVNGREVFKGQANDQMLIPIYKDDVKLGENTIELQVSRNSEIKGRAKIEIIYSKVLPHRVQVSFYVDGKVMRLLEDGGYISFSVVKIHKDGGLVVRIRDRHGEETFRKYLDLKVGTYNILISSSDVRYGQNVIEIDAVDGGLFEVSGVQVVG